MNLEDLKQTLATMAADVKMQDPVTRLAGVDSKVSTVRRRQAAGAGFGVAAVAAVLALLVPDVLSARPGGVADPAGNGNQTSQRPLGGLDRTYAPTLPTVTDKGAVFYSAPAGDTLIGEAVGSPGQTSVTLTVTPNTRDLSYVEFCWQRRPRSTSAEFFDATVNGKPYVSSACGSDRHGPFAPEFRFSRDPEVNASRWQRMGVTPGAAMTVRLDVLPRQRQLARTERVQLGLAVYANTGPTVEDHGLTIPTQAVVAGHSYELIDRAFRRFGGSRGVIDLPLPSTDSPLFTVTGVRGLSGPYVVNGSDGTLDKSATGGASQVSGPVRRGQQVARASVHSRQDPSGLLYVLIYRQAD